MPTIEFDIPDPEHRDEMFAEEFLRQVSEMIGWEIEDLRLTPVLTSQEEHK